MTDRSHLVALAACILLAACQTTAPAVGTAQPKRRPAASALSKLHHATFANGRRSMGSEAQFASDCPWPAHTRTDPAARGSTSAARAGGATKADGVESEGCAILRFSLSPSGHVNWIEVVTAKPQSIGPLALKCLLAARFKPDPHPEAASLVRVDVQKLAGDVTVAALKLR